MPENEHVAFEGARERLGWRLLRRFLPQWYRERYADDLLHLHVDRETTRCTREGRPPSGAAFWLAVTRDVLVTSFEARCFGAERAGTVGRTLLHEGSDALNLREIVHGTIVTTRALVKSPAFTVTAIGTLALGIGAATAIFSVVYGALLKPLPYQDPADLVRVRDWYTPTGGSGAMSLPNFLHLDDHTPTLEELAAYTQTSLNLAFAAEPERIGGLRVTQDFLSTLGVQPIAGRGFAVGEDGPAAQRVVVLGYRLWLDRFEGSADALGKSLLLDGEAHTVIGVLPADFWFPGEPELLLPLGWSEQNLQSRGSRYLESIARLEPGATVADAQRALRTTFAPLEREFPDSNRDWTVEAQPISEWAVGRSRTAYLLVAGAAAMVLLIGCFNVANLMLVRAERRQGEIAVRAAMGASRGALGRQLLAESLMIAIGATVLGLAIASVGIQVLVDRFGSGLPRASSIGIDPLVILFAIALALLVSFAVTAVPLVRLDTRRLHDALREGRNEMGSAAGRRFQGALVGLEVVLAVVLVAGAGLLLNSAWQTSRIDSGLDLDNAMVFRVDLPTASYTEPHNLTNFYRRAVAEVEALPQVAAVGITDRPPLRGGYNITTLASPDDPELEASFVEVRRVTPGFFEAAGIPLISGRMLTEADGNSGAQVVVISDELASTIFPDGGAVGSTIQPGWNPNGFEVVGVVGSVRDFGVLRDRRPAIYWPYPVPYPAAGMTFVVRTAVEPMQVMPSIRTALQAIDPTLPLYGAATLEEISADSLGTQRLATGLFVTFGVCALLLAALGVFSILAYAVELRTREIGMRIALGAPSGRVIGMVVGQGLRLVGAGLVAGIVVALAAGRFLAELLVGVEPTDPLTLTVVVVVILSTAVVAAWLPAQRATRVPPSSALRAD